MTSLLSPIHHRSITRMAVCEKPGPKISSKRNITRTSPILPLWDVTSRYKDRDGGGLRASGRGKADF
jgi:hypothetical protein